MKFIALLMILTFLSSLVFAENEYCPEDSITIKLAQRTWSDSSSKTVSEILLRATLCESSTWYKIDSLYSKVDSIPSDSILGYYQNLPELRLQLIRFIARYKMVNMVKWLHQRLSNDSDTYVQSAAASALGAIGPRAAIAIPALIEGLRDRGTSGLCSNAVDALGEMGDKGAAGVPFLTAMLKDDRWYIRWRVARSLGKLGYLSYSAVPALRESLQDEHPQVRKFAGSAIELIQLATKER